MPNHLTFLTLARHNIPASEIITGKVHYLCSLDLKCFTVVVPEAIIKIEAPKSASGLPKQTRLNPREKREVMFSWPSTPLLLEFVS